MDNFRTQLNTANETYSSLCEEIDNAIDQAKNVLRLHEIDVVEFENLDTKIEVYTLDQDVDMTKFEYDEGEITIYDEDNEAYLIENMSITDKLVCLEMIRDSLREILSNEE